MYLVPKEKYLEKGLFEFYSVDIINTIINDEILLMYDNTKYKIQ